jgi:spermidine synthase
MKIEIIENNNYQIYLIDNLPQLLIPKEIEKISKMGEIMFIEKISQKNRLNILNIGLGAGYTIREILKRKNVKSLEVIEIFQEVIDNLIMFDTYDTIINDNRCRIICDDASNYVKKTTKKYDAIIIDVCQPEISYSGKLFEEEFLMNMKKILNYSGMILIWYYKINNNNYEHANKTIKTLKKHYTHVDLINLVDSLFNDTYFYISNICEKYDKNSIIDNF